MESSIEFDVWRMVPPEEKFELMARAQSKGVFACLIAIIVCSTIAVGFKMSWIMWASFICSPFIFQFAAGKAWRTLRPKAMLEYLAVRSASRRYAFAVKAKDLTPNLIMRGILEEIYDNDHLHEAMEAMIQNTKEAEVWVTLFGDAVVMIAEAPGGAELKFSHLIDEKMIVTSRAKDGKDYSSLKELFIKVRDKEGGAKNFKLTSRYPAALVVFEKKINSVASPIAAKVEDLISLPEVAAVGDDDKFDNLFSFN